MPRIFLVFLLLLLVAGGGTGAWWFGVRGEPLPFFGGDTAEAPPQTSEFVELKPLTFPIVRDGRVSRLMTLVISIEVLGESAREAVHKKAPVLRDAMLSELHGLYAHSFMNQRDDPMALVKLRLLKVGRKVLGEELRGVYVQAVEGARQPARS